MQTKEPSRQQLHKLCKHFGRRFNNIDSWFKKHKRCFNQLNLIKTTTEPPVSLTKCKGKPHASTDNKNSSSFSTLHIGPTVISGLTPLRILPDLGTNTIIKSCHQIVTSLWKQASQIGHHNLFRSACKITRAIVAPLLWAMMLITSIKGETFLCQHFQVDSPMSHDRHFKNEQHARKIVCANQQLRKLHDHQQHRHQFFGPQRCFSQQ